MGRHGGGDNTGASGAASAPAPAQDPSNSQGGQVVGINIQHMVRQVMRRKTLGVGGEKKRDKKRYKVRDSNRERERERQN